ncbi:MAG: thermonuclease family protein [Xanthobacteraceae bacterium]
MRSSGDSTGWGARRGRTVAAALFAAAAGFASCATAEGIAVCADAGKSFAGVEAVGADYGAAIRLADGRKVRLAGVIAANEFDGADAAQRSMAALNALVAGKRVSLHGDAGKQDRYGRFIAQVTIDNDPARWVQAVLVGDGAARVAPAGEASDCARALLRVERVARAAKSGLWAENGFAVLAARSVPELLGAAGRFAIVEGAVRRVGELGGRLYLDFGRRYNEDFTIVIPREAQTAFAAAGFDLRNFAGMRIRARGVVFLLGGPALELRVPAALEVIGAEGT